MKPVPANVARSVLKPNWRHAGFLLCGEAPSFTTGEDVTTTISPSPLLSHGSCSLELKEIAR